jgi:hypothetical protein
VAGSQILLEYFVGDLYTIVPPQKPTDTELNVIVKNIAVIFVFKVATEKKQKRTIVR